MKSLSLLFALIVGFAAVPAFAADGIVKTGVQSSRFSAKPVALRLRSSAVLVIAQDSGEQLFAKNVDQVMPIASITKLMTAMVVLDSGLPLL
jgi:D-alanyl-D-alanine endopeptidase (penicillin-binding protein 7)